MVKIIRERKAIYDEVQKLKAAGKKVGFVPTMGALHEGHLSLIRSSVKENDVTIVSIFVNPIQFNQASDFENYPITPDEDLAKLEANNCDLLFLPSQNEMYPEGLETDNDFNPGYLGEILEGAYRPGHFQGVATIVKKLFDATNPDLAYFGQKDYQQLLIVQKLVKDYKLNIEIKQGAICREPEGLAISSRNVRLTNDQRKWAPEIYQTLLKAKQALQSREISTVKHEALKQLNEIPEAKAEYFEILNAQDLTNFEANELPETIVICATVWLGEVRLIDNILVKANEAYAN